MQIQGLKYRAGSYRATRSRMTYGSSPGQVQRTGHTQHLEGKIYQKRK